MGANAVEQVMKANMSSETNVVDKDKLFAYELSIAAEKLLRSGNVEEAKKEMAKAADLDKTYVVHAEYLGKKSTRNICFTATVRDLLVKELCDLDFAVLDGKEWREGKELHRRGTKNHQAVIIGRDKFGKRLGILAAKWEEGELAEYFDWRTIGIRSGTMAYTSQEELEAVCARWIDYIRRYLLPWFEAN